MIYIFLLAALCIATVSAFNPLSSFLLEASSKKHIHPTILKNRKLLNSRNPAAQKTTTTTLNMFGGAGAAGSESDVEAEAKQMGMSVKEYNLAMRMRSEFAAKLAASRSTAKAGPGVSVTYDGNIRPVQVDVSDEGIALGKSKLEEALITAMNDAMKGAQQDMQREMQQMQKSIASEMGDK